MWILGDVHGEFDRYADAIRETKLPDGRKGLSSSIQVGDMGVFTEADAARLPELPGHVFFRGNHDNSEHCRSHANYLGDYGYNPENDLFWVGGAKSYDAKLRYSGIDLFDDEELSYPELSGVVELYTESKPAIVISHDCPTVIRREILELKGSSRPNETSRTELALQAMYEAHKPDLWVFGHHHVPMEREIGGVKFVCLDEFIRGKAKDCMFEIPEIELG